MDFQKWVTRLGSEIILLEVNFFQSCENQGTSVHSHPGQLHVACFEKGSGICVISGVRHKIHPGDIYLILPGEMHQFQTDPQHPYRACFLHFSWFGQLPAELPQEIKIPRNARNGFFKLCKELSELSKKWSKQTGGEFFYYGNLLNFWGNLIRFAATAAKGDDPSRPSTGINKLLNPVIEKLYGPPFFYPGIDELAEANNMSRRQLTKLFKAHIGCSIKQYYLANIMRYARKVRNRKNMTTAELARQCGYSSAQNFLLAYKKYFSHHPENPPAGETLIWRGKNN